MALKPRIKEELFILFGAVFVVVITILALLPRGGSDLEQSDATQTASETVELSPSDRSQLEDVSNSFLQTSLNFGYNVTADDWNTVRTALTGSDHVVSYTDVQSKLKGVLADGSPLYLSEQDLNSNDITLSDLGISQKSTSVDISVPNEGVKKAGSRYVRAFVKATVNVSRSSYVYLGTGEGQPQDYSKTSSSLKNSGIEIELRKTDSGWKVFNVKADDIDAYAFYNFTDVKGSSHWTADSETLIKAAEG